MACACSKKRRAQQFLWYDPQRAEAVEPVVYDSKIEAQAKVIRKGGTFIPYDANVSIGQQIAIAEAAG